MPTASFTATGARTGTERPLAWLEFVLQQPDLDTTTYRWSDRAINDTLRKEARVLEFGSVRHALSSWRGDFEGTSAGVTLADTDRVLATLLADAEDQYWLNREARLFLTHALDHAAGKDPLVLLRGILRSYSGALSWQWGIEDQITSQYGGLETDERLPRRVIGTAQFPNCPPAALGLPEPILFGTLTSATGAVPTIFCDDNALWLTLMVAGHACKEITGWFQGGVDLSGEAVDGRLLIPGVLGQPMYEDVAGRRYSLLYLHTSSFAAEKVMDGTAPIYVNVKGMETVGDGTGTLYEEITNVFFHVLKNFVLGDYQSGAWLSAPQWADGTAKLDSASFAAVMANHQTRLPAAGYTSAGAIGLDGFQTVQEIIKRFCLCCDAQVGFTRAGSMVLRDDDGTTATISQSDTLDVETNSLVLTMDPESQFTRVPYLYAEPYTGGSWLSAMVLNAAAETDWKQSRTASELSLPYIRSSAVAESIASYWLRRHMNPPWRVSWRTGLHGLGVELGQIVDLTHALGLGASGYSSRAIRIEGIEVDPRGRVTLSGTDRDAYPAVSYTTAEWSTNRSTSTVATVVPSPSVVTIAVSAPMALGGSRQLGVRSASYVRVREYQLVLVPWSQYPTVTEARAYVEVRTDAVGTSVTPRIYNVTDAAAAATGSPATDTVWTDAFQTLLIARPADNADKHYVLEVVGGNANAAVYAAGYMRISP